MNYCFDLDGTICDTPLRKSDNKPGYLESTPIPYMVEQVNKLYDDGHKIIIMTARGRGSGIDWTGLTIEQLDRWGVKYHDLEPMFHKPTADIFIDDKGIIAGAFDVIHPGYIKMFKDAKAYCNHLTVALHLDPSIERDVKLKPVHTKEERKEILLALKDVDDVIFYEVENGFLNYLRSGDYHIRFLGTDYLNGNYTGKDIPIDIVWLSRDHNYSTTRLKTLIYNSVKYRKDRELNYD